MTLTKWSIPHGWKDSIDKWLNSLTAQGRRKSTLETRRFDLAKLARAFPRDCPASLSLDDLEPWLATQAWAPATRHGFMNSLRSFFRWCEKQGISQNIADCLPASHRVPRSLSQPCPHEVIDHAVSTAGEREALMIRLGCFQGLRRGEIARLQASDAQCDGGEWELFIRGKGGKDRRIPLRADLGSAIARLGPGFIFPGDEAGHLSARYVGTLIGRALPHPWTAHSLRHRFATDLWRATGDVVIVQHMLGHSSPHTTMTYLHVGVSDLRAGMNAFNEFVSEVSGRMSTTEQDSSMEGTQ